jgi:hypothetical protein
MNRIRRLGMGDPAFTSVYPAYLVALSAAGLVIMSSFFWAFPTFFRDVSVAIRVNKKLFSPSYSLN